MAEVFVEMFIRSQTTAPEELILDFDPTNDPVHGNQEQRFFHGYYDQYCFLLLSAAAYILLDTLRRQALADTELAHAQVDTIRLKQLKIGARVVSSVRRVVIHLAGGCPLKDLFAGILDRLRALPTSPLTSG